MSEYDMILRLSLACFLGGLIGLERESLNRPAGLRTYTLVCMGSALAMMVSLEMYYEYHATVNADPGRIAAQVISGIGFLGAGTIMREGANIQGLTTAAGLWVVACVGLAVGAGMYLAAVVTTALILMVLVYFFKLEDKISGLREYKLYKVTMADKPGQIGRVGMALGEEGVHIKNIKLSHVEGDKLEVEMMLKLPSMIRPRQIAEILHQVPGVDRVEHQD